MEQRKKAKAQLNILGRKNAPLILGVLTIMLVFAATANMNRVVDESPDHKEDDIPKSLDYKVDDTCLSLPTIRPSGSYFLDANIKNAASHESLSPGFAVGTYIGPKVTYHMNEPVLFALVKEAVSGKDGGLTFDIGANQGFFTYYLAALGMEVHSFEIYEPNFKALQHGAEFNTKEVADRVHLYPVGLGQTNGRFSMQGNNYEGFLKQGAAGNILGVKFDCFAQHSQLDLSDVAFVKLDVEGFETAVLSGAQNSLFSENAHIGGMLMEAGPGRWSRAGIDLKTGIEEMKKLASNFKDSYIVTRKAGTYAKTCPVSLGEKHLADKDPRVFPSDNVVKVESGEWEALLTAMATDNMDCNFFYKN